MIAFHADVVEPNSDAGKRQREWRGSARKGRWHVRTFGHVVRPFLRPALEHFGKGLLELSALADHTDQIRG